MTPVQIFEYKQKWMADGKSNPVRYHSDWRSQAIEFCKKNFGKMYWHNAKYTGIYEDTMYFEHVNHAEFFSDYMEVTQKKPELDWTDDEYYEGAWSWVDECELDDEDKH